MKYAGLFMLLGIFTAAFAFVRGGWWLLLLWPALNFFMNGAGYLSLGPRVFGKQLDGSIPLWNGLIWFPYRYLILGPTWHLARIVSKERSFDQVTHGLIVGRRLLASEKLPDVDNWIDLTSEFLEPIAIVEEFNYIPFPILDGHVPVLDELCTMMETLPPGKTYIHCAQGHGRTGLVAIAWLVQRGEADTYEEALALLQEARPALKLNHAQQSFAREFIRHITGKH